MCYYVGPVSHLITANHSAIVKTTAQTVMRMNPPISMNRRPFLSISRF